MLSVATKQLQLTEEVKSEHQEHPGLQVLSTKQFELVESVNSAQQ